ncbi:MAG TPA: hypothetical protein VI316_00590 [Candidatus Dormibacteraeota bacterium]
MSEQRLGSAEIYAAAGVVGVVFGLAAVVAYRLAPEESASILTALVVAVTAVAVLALAAGLEERLPEAVVEARGGGATPEEAELAPLARWMQRVDLAADNDDAQLIARLQDPLARVAVRLGADRLPEEVASASTPEALLDAVERL